MGTAGDSNEVRQMATAMVALDHSGWQQQWSALNGNVKQQQQWRRKVATAGSSNEVCQMVAAMDALNGDGWQRQ